MKDFILCAALTIIICLFLSWSVSSATPSHTESSVYVKNLTVFQVGPYEITEFQRNNGLHRQTCTIVRHTKGAMARNGIAMNCTF